MDVSWAESSLFPSASFSLAASAALSASLSFLLASFFNLFSFSSGVSFSGGLATSSSRWRFFSSLNRFLSSLFKRFSFSSEVSSAVGAAVSASPASFLTLGAFAFDFFSKSSKYPGTLSGLNCCFKKSSTNLLCVGDGPPSCFVKMAKSCIRAFSISSDI